MKRIIEEGRWNDMKRIREMKNLNGTATLRLAALALALILWLGMTGPALADCENSPLRCIYLDDKGEVHTDTTSKGQCADSWGHCSVSNCGGDTCGGMYYTCARTYNVSENQVREANAYGKDCRR